MTSETVARYRFPGVDGAWWLGLRPLPIVWLAAVVTVTVLALYGGAPLPVGAATLLVGGVVALVPVGDRVAVEWAPVAVRAAAARAVGAHRWHDPNPLAPARVAADWGWRLPAELGGGRVLDVDGVGVVDDRQHALPVGVLAVAGTDRFGLSDAAEQARLLDGWGATLAALAADPRVARLQWLERAAPEDRDPGEWLRRRAGDVDSAAAADYLQLVRDVTSEATRHDVWLAVAFTRTATSAVPLALADVAGRMLSARLVARPVAGAELAGLLRRCLGGSAADAQAVHRVAPLSRSEAWDHVRVDDGFHRAFAVTGWPRLPLSPGWLEPLFLAAPPGAARTVSVHLHPVPATEAIRRARSARSRARLDATDRARLGLVDSARVEADAAEAAATEEELVAGYRLHRISAVITVTGATPAKLDDAARAVRTAAETARLELRPLHGQHAAALTATLPLCRPAGRSR